MMAESRKTWTRRPTAEKARAVGIALVEGVTETERQTGIPAESIQYWLNQPQFAELRIRAREDIVADVRAAFLKALARTAELIDRCDDLRDVGDTADKLGNRYALLAGEATVRTETRAITEGLDDHERTALRDAIDAWLAREPAAARTGGDKG